jgi:hypothetical protein
MAALATLTPGCMTPRGSTKRVYVYLQEDGTFLVRGKEVVRDRLPGHLKSLGATSRTWISLVAPVDTSPDTSKAILKEISRGGFPVVTAEGPKRVTVETKTSPPRSVTIDKK